MHNTPLLISLLPDTGHNPTQKSTDCNEFTTRMNLAFPGNPTQTRKLGTEERANNKSEMGNTYLLL